MPLLPLWTFMVCCRVNFPFCYLFLFWQICCDVAGFCEHDDDPWVCVEVCDFLISHVTTKCLGRLCPLVAPSYWRWSSVLSCEGKWSVCCHWEQIARGLFCCTTCATVYAIELPFHQKTLTTSFKKSIMVLSTPLLMGMRKHAYLSYLQHIPFVIKWMTLVWSTPCQLVYIYRAVTASSPAPKWDAHGGCITVHYPPFPESCNLISSLLNATACLSCVLKVLVLLCL